MRVATRKRLIITDRMVLSALSIDATVSTNGDGDLPIEFCTWDEPTIVAAFVRWLRLARKAHAAQQRRTAMRENVIQGGKA